MASSGKTPFLSVDEITRLGYKLMILPNFAALAAIKAMAEVLTEIKRSGSVAGVLDRCANFQEFAALGGTRAAAASREALLCSRLTKHSRISPQWVLQSNAHPTLEFGTEAAAG